MWVYGGFGWKDRNIIDTDRIRVAATLRVGVFVIYVFTMFVLTMDTEDIQDDCNYRGNTLKSIQKLVYNIFPN